MNAGSAPSIGFGRERPLVVCGMHRSGTSLVASLLTGAGVHLGDELLEPSAHNPLGHFEDVGILDFHRVALAANGIISEGYTTQADIAMTPALKRRAVELLAARAGRGRQWGWKEPRTTLFLDFWSSVLPEARFLLVFRRPWEVVDSLYRRGETTFRTHPAFALDVWMHYNRLLLDFAVRHPHRALVCETTQIAADAAGLFERIRHKLQVAVGEPPERYDASLLHQETDAGRPALLAALCPAAWSLYRQLCDLAGSVGTGTVEGAETTPADLQRHLLADWARSADPEFRAGGGLRQPAGEVAHGAGPADACRDDACRGDAGRCDAGRCDAGRGDAGRREWWRFGRRQPPPQAA